MKRLLKLAVSCVLVIGVVLPGGVAAQQGSSLGHGKGESADAVTEQQARRFIDEYIARFNNYDVGVVDMVDEAEWPTYFGSDSRAGAESNVRNRYLFPITLRDTRDVRTHEDGHVSIELSYSGYNTAASYYTGRWYLKEVDGGEYQLDEGASRVPRALDGMTTATVAAVVEDKGLSVSEDSVPAVELLLIDVRNPGNDGYFTTGIYVLPDNVSIAQAQAELVAGDVQSLTYLGSTPARPGEEWTYGFLIEPGTTYLVQQYTLDEQGQSPKALAGEAYATTLRIGDASAGE